MYLSKILFSEKTSEQTYVLLATATASWEKSQCGVLLSYWEALPWPKEAGPIPNNAIICTTQGPGLTALGGGDYDGDDVSVTDNASLVTFLEETTAAYICTSIRKGLRLEPPERPPKTTLADLKFDTQTDGLGMLL